MASKQSALRSFLIAALAGAVGAGTYTLAADTSETDTGDQASSTTASSTVSPIRPRRSPPPTPAPA